MTFAIAITLFIVAATSALGAYAAANRWSADHRSRDVFAALFASIMTAWLLICGVWMLSHAMF